MNAISTSGCYFDDLGLIHTDDCSCDQEYQVKADYEVEIYD